MSRYVIANDLSPAATEIMRRNVLYNGLGPEDPSEVTENATSPSLGRVRVNEGDAW